MAADTVAAGLGDALSGCTVGSVGERRTERGAIGAIGVSPSDLEHRAARSAPAEVARGRSCLTRSSTVFGATRPGEPDAGRGIDRDGAVEQPTELEHGRFHPGCQYGHPGCEMVRERWEDPASPLACFMEVARTKRAAGQELEDKPVGGWAGCLHDVEAE